jgi:hypothetical protein
MLLASEDQVGQLVRCRVFALVAIAQQSPRSLHYERRRDRNDSRSRRAAQRQGLNGVALDGRFQAPLVPHIAAFGTEFRSGSGGPVAAMTAFPGSRAQIASAREAVRWARPARRLCAQFQRKV